MRKVRRKISEWIQIRGFLSYETSLFDKYFKQPRVVTTAKWSMHYFEIGIEMCIDFTQFQTQSRSNSIHMSIIDTPTDADICLKSNYTTISILKKGRKGYVNDKARENKRYRRQAGSGKS